MKGVGSGWSRQTCQLHILQLQAHRVKDGSMLIHMKDKYLYVYLQGKFDWALSSLSSNTRSCSSSEVPSSNCGM